MEIEQNAHNIPAPASDTCGGVQGEHKAELSLPQGWTFDRRSPVISVEQLMIHWHLEIKYDGRIVRIDAPLMADRPETVGDYLDAEPLSISELLDDIMLAAVEAGVKVNPRILKAATYKIIRRKRKQRRKQLFAHLTDRRPDSKANSRLHQCLAELFDQPPKLTIGCIAHWIWQVKQKMLGRPVEHHMMLFIFSKEQGNGKSTFVRKLVGPLAEFASGDVLIEDLADRRSEDIFRFPVVVLDDMGRALTDSVSTIKSVMTSDNLNRREMYTSRSKTLRQAATFIGTANRPIHELIDDDSGHRRFVMMPFKSGGSTAGEKERLWKIVNELNFEGLWLSVDAFGPSPILEILTELRDYQTTLRPLPKVHQWAINLDLSSEEMKSITVRGGVRAEALRDLYVAQTGDQISNQKFSDEMLTCTKNARMPFSGKQRKEVGALYIIRPASERDSERTVQPGPGHCRPGGGCQDSPHDPAAPEISLGQPHFPSFSGEAAAARPDLSRLSSDASDRAGSER
jgi:hypothetical protein